MHSLQWLFALVVSISTWLTPQPKLSAGLLVNYGSRELVRANAEWHGYTLPDDCGIASIGAAHLGRLVYVSVDRVTWIGPCRVVDVAARIHFYDSVYVRHEVAEIPRWMANQLGFEYGSQGYVWFGACPPPDDYTPQEYAPVLKWDTPPLDWTPSLFPYPPEQKIVVDCNRKSIPAGHTESE